MNSFAQIVNYMASAIDMVTKNASLTTRQISGMLTNHSNSFHYQNQHQQGKGRRRGRSRGSSIGSHGRGRSRGQGNRGNTSATLSWDGPSRRAKLLSFTMQSHVPQVREILNSKTSSSHALRRGLYQARWCLSNKIYLSLICTALILEETRSTVK